MGIMCRYMNSLRSTFKYTVLTSCHTWELGGAVPSNLALSQYMQSCSKAATLQLSSKVYTHCMPLEITFVDKITVWYTCTKQSDTVAAWHAWQAGCWKDGVDPKLVAKSTFRASLQKKQRAIILQSRLIAVLYNSDEEEFVELRPLISYSLRRKL